MLLQRSFVLTVTLTMSAPSLCHFIDSPFSIASNIHYLSWLSRLFMVYPHSTYFWFTGERSSQSMISTFITHLLNFQTSPFMLFPMHLGGAPCKLPQSHIIVLLQVLSATSLLLWCLHKTWHWLEARYYLLTELISVIFLLSKCQIPSCLSNILAQTCQCTVAVAIR